MQRTIPTIFLVFAVLFVTAGTSWGQVVEYEDLVQRDGLYYLKSTDVPFTGKTTGTAQLTFREGIRHGPFAQYYDNGRLEIKGAYINGKRDGPWVFYHENEQLWVRGALKVGVKDGPWISYYENGQLSYKGNFLNGYRDGPWVFYNNDGMKHWRSGTYRNGEKISD